MPRTIEIFSLADVDRSGKVRWLAAELGLEVVEQRLDMGAHRQEPYLGLNPLGQVPTVRFDGRLIIESTALLHTVAESFEEPRLWVARGQPEREPYLFWLAAFGENTEGRLVEMRVSQNGLLGPEYFQLHESGMRRKVGVLAGMLPSSGYLCGDRFTIADIVAGYNLRLAVQTGLVDRSACEPYLGRLVERPAAQASRIFASLA